MVSPASGKREASSRSPPVEKAEGEGGSHEAPLGWCPPPLEDGGLGPKTVTEGESTDGVEERMGVPAGSTSDCS